MVDQTIEISFFKKSRICSNPKHKISFEDDDDIYNPFSSKNTALSLKLRAEDNEELYDCFYQIAVLLDLSKSSHLSFSSAMNNILKDRLHALICKAAKENSKELLSIKVPFWGMCMKVSAQLDFN